VRESGIENQSIGISRKPWDSPMLFDAGAQAFGLPSRPAGCYHESVDIPRPLSKEASMWWQFKPYVSVANRRANAVREVNKLAKKGHKTSPVEIAGRAIATTFWGKAWCDHLESYSDFSNRLPRGRTYARNGSVVDLQIEPGKVTSLVSGSSLYRITIKIKPLASKCWGSVKSQCGGQIGSMVELLQGKLSKDVMGIVTRRDGGMFPTPVEIEMSCSCPDYAGMCKHVAATLYGVGNRLDHQPELLFKLRQVDHLELIAQAASPIAKSKTPRKKTIAADQLADVFGIELEGPGINRDIQVTAKSTRQPKAVKVAVTTSVKKRPKRRRPMAVGLER
jgi:uncharacterized Zn finger protein